MARESLSTEAQVVTVDTERQHPLVEMLRARGVKAYWLNEQMGWSYQVLRAIKRGQRELTASEVVKLAALFDVPPETFLPEVA